jgi:hypothetical protein
MTLNTTILKTGAGILLMLTCIFSACKKEETTTTTPAVVTKTLNKGTLTPKKWYSEGSSVIHDFKANGVYNVSGSWSWVNSSDTMQIVTQSGFPPVYWKMFWNTTTEMSAERIDQKVTLLFKDKAW